MEPSILSTASTASFDVVFQVSGEGAAVVALVPPRLEDTGVYTCRAVNEIGVDVSVITVNVMGQLCDPIMSIVSMASCNHVSSVS